MARTRVAKLAFNRGLVSRLGLARSDIKRLAFAAAVHINWVPRVLGSMMLRPGLQYLASSRNDAQAFYIPFVFSTTDKAKIEITDGAMRVWVNDAVVTRPAVNSAILNGTFDANLNNWTDADEFGGTSAWQAGGYMGLTGNGTAHAARRQLVAVPVASRNVEHALHIVIERGPVVLRVGSTAGGDEYINETELATGTHSLAFTPSGNFYVEFKSRLQRIVLVASCAIEAAGAMVVETPWAEEDLRKIRHDQSGDVIFLACDGYHPYRIERRATRSWSAVLYLSSDGPFRIENTTPTTLLANDLNGNITLTASAPVFRPGHVGALFQHVSVGQRVKRQITTDNVFSDPIRITGGDGSRGFAIQITGLSATGSTVTLQRSFEEPGSWEDVKTWTGDTIETYDDNLHNQIIYYRIGVKTGDYVAGIIETLMITSLGSITGVARITAYTSSTVVRAEVLSAIGSNVETEFWSEGEWSDYRGYPTAVAFHEGRLVWAGRDALQASISDAFDGFDPEFEGDAGPINRTIGSGAVDRIQWALPLQRLIIGGEGAEHSVRSSSLDEPITPTNFNIKQASTQGSAAVAAVKVDQTGIFVQRGGVRVYEMSFGETGIDYEASHLSALKPDIGLPGIVKILVQRQPDTRLHFIRSDGTVALLIFDKLEQVTCWLEIETDGEIEDGVVLPGDVGDAEDHVYYSVKRTIGANTKRYLEKWAFEIQCRGGTVNRQADSFLTYSQAASSTIGGLGHLEGKAVVVWDNGKCLADADDEIATFTVSGGQISVTHRGAAYQATQGVVGLPYEAPWQSAKLVELMEELEASLTDTQMLKAIALIIADVHVKGIKYGQTLTEADMRELPQIGPNGDVLDPDTVLEDYTTDKLAPAGEWTQDARLCLLAKAPRPVTVLAAIAEVEHHG